MHRSVPRLIALAAVAALLLTAIPAARAADAPDGLLPAGSPAPLFEAVDIDGQPFVLADALKEGPVLLVFWSIFCGTCRDELPIIEQERPKFPNGLQVVTVNLDEAPRARTVKGFAQQQGFSFRMVLNRVEGKEFQIEQAYQVKVTPTLYLLDSDGTVAYGHTGALSPEQLLEVVAKAK